MNKSCNIDITHVISDQVSGNLTIVKSILHDQSSHVISKLCRIASTCQLSCNVDITPYRINIKSHNFAMFSPATAAAILNCRNQNRGQEPSSSVTSTRRTSPRLQPAAEHARGGASSQGLLSGGTTESRILHQHGTHSIPPIALWFSRSGGNTYWILRLFHLSLH